MVVKNLFVLYCIGHVSRHNCTKYKQIRETKVEETSNIGNGFVRFPEISIFCCHCIRRVFSVHLSGLYYGVLGVVDPDTSDVYRVCLQGLSAEQATLACRELGLDAATIHPGNTFQAPQHGKVGTKILRKSFCDTRNDGHVLYMVDKYTTTTNNHIRIAYVIITIHSSHTYIATRGGSIWLLPKGGGGGGGGLR